MEAAPSVDANQPSELGSSPQHQSNDNPFRDCATSTPVNAARTIDVSNVYSRTNIGSGATPAFEPRKPVLNLNTSNTQADVNGPAPIDASNVYATQINHPQVQYWPAHGPAYPTFAPYYYSTPRYVPNGSAPRHRTPASLRYRDPVDPESMSHRIAVHTHTPMEPGRVASHPADRVQPSMAKRDIGDGGGTPRLPPSGSFASNANLANPNPTTYAPTGATHTNSHTWTSEQHEELKRYNATKAKLHRMEVDLRSPFVPQDFKEWLEFKAGQKEDHMKEMKIRIKNKAAKVNLNPPFGGTPFNDGRGAVLAQTTIWHEPFNPIKLGRDVADWPCAAEMDEEGNQRNTTMLGRHFPYPREPSQQPTHYRSQNYVRPFDIDQTWKVPNMETYEDSKTPDAEDMKWQQIEMLGEGFMRHLDIDPRRK